MISFFKCYWLVFRIANKLVSSLVLQKHYFSEFNHFVLNGDAEVSFCKKFTNRIIDSGYNFFFCCLHYICCRFSNVYIVTIEVQLPMLVRIRYSKPINLSSSFEFYLETFKYIYNILHLNKTNRTLQLLLPDKNTQSTHWLFKAH